MSQLRVTVVLTNATQQDCTLQGWPGVSFVGNGNGTQLGAPATLARGSKHPTVTLASGGSAMAPLHYTQAAVYPAGECNQSKADGVRVFPPGSTQSLFIKWPQDACALKTHPLLDVSAFVAVTGAGK